MSHLLEIYGDPLFLWFPLMTVVISVGGFLSIALPMTWLAVASPAWLRPYRVQDQPAEASTAIWPPLAWQAQNMAWLLALAVIAWPLLRLTKVHAGGWPSWQELAWQLPLFLVVDDVGNYLVHRLMHGRWLFKRVHALHHRMARPTALAGAYFHPVEYLLLNIVAIIGPLAVGADVVTIWLWVVFRQWITADGHSGYKLPWSPGRLLPWYPGPAFHDSHHQRFVGNYANYFACLDRWFGTQSPGYAEPPASGVTRRSSGGR